MLYVKPLQYYQVPSIAKALKTASTLHAYVYSIASEGGHLHKETHHTRAMWPCA